MTARTLSPLDKNGKGVGKKVVTKPFAKKRGASADRTEVIADNRRNLLDISSVPAAQIGETVDPNKPLSEKAKLFISFWAQGESIANASAKAGYGDGATYAYRLVRYPQAIALYNAEKALYEEASQMSRKKVMDMLLESYDMAKLMAEPASMVSAAREVGKMCGYFDTVKKVEVNVTGNVMFDRMNRMSDDELLKLITAADQDTTPLIEHDEEETE